MVGHLSPHGAPLATPHMVLDTGSAAEDRPIRVLSDLLMLVAVTGLIVGGWML